MPKKSGEVIISEFRTISQQYADASVWMHEAIAKKVGLSGPDYRYLGILLQKGEMTAGELAKYTGLTTGAVTGLIDRLEKKKLLERRFDKTDRRKVIIRPDVPGIMALLGPYFQELQQKSIDLLASFSEGEIKAIERYLVTSISLMTEAKQNLEGGGKG